MARLLRVERDSNQLRRFGYVSPHIGKVAPLNAGALGDISGLAAAALPTGPTLLIGTTESALILAWFLAAYIGPDARLVFTTRERRGSQSIPRRTFLEPHSHGPIHSLVLPPGEAFHQRVVIVEDEITTGATLRNLLLTIRDVSDEHHVVTLADLRPAASRESLRGEMAGLGIELSVTDLSRARDAGLAVDATDLYPAPWHNPFGRPEGVLEEAVDVLRHRWRKLRPGALYAIGECVDVALSFWDSLPPAQRPTFRHVTRSPWLVDGRIVTSRLDFRVPRTPRHFLYNWTCPLPPRALLVSERSTAGISARLSDFLASQGVETGVVEVP